MIHRLPCGARQDVIHFRSSGAVSALEERLINIDEPLGDLISRTRNDCENALGQAVSLSSNTSDEAEALHKQAQVQTGKMIALQRLQRFPAMLQWLLKEYKRVLAVVKQVPEHLSLRDARAVWDPAEHAPELRGYELVATGDAQRDLLAKASDDGRADAQLLLGEMYHDADLLRIAGFSGELDAQVLCGILDMKDNYVDLYGAAKQGHPEAQARLALAEENDQEALAWDRKAVEQEHADAQYRLGHRYEQGTGVARNLQLAKELYAKSAAQGNLQAKAGLGKLET